MSRPSPATDGPAVAARACLPYTDRRHFDRLTAALLASPSAPLGPLLRAELPGTTGVRWLHHEGLPPTTTPAALTAAQWQSLFACWSSTRRAPGAGGPPGRGGGRPAPHGHAPGARAIPRWGS